MILNYESFFRTSELSQLSFSLNRLGMLKLFLCLASSDNPFEAELNANVGLKVF